jgi:hypothetical protein
MARLTVVSQEEVQGAHRPVAGRGPDSWFAFYRALIRGLRSEQVGILELEPTDRLATERTRLRRAAQAEGIDLIVHSQGALLLYFYIKTAQRPREAQADPDLPAFLRDAPLDDEPLTPEDEAAIEEGRAAIARGDVITLEALRAELGL